MTNAGSRKKTKSAFAATPKNIVTILLIIDALIAAIFSKTTTIPVGGLFNHSAPSGILTQSLINMAVAVVTALVIDFLVGLFYERKRAYSDGGLITGLIVAMALSTSTTWYVVAATTGLAIASKHILKRKRKPIFNPAAFGLLLSTFIFQSGQSWWAGMTLLPNAYMIVLAICIVIIAQRVRKFPQVIAFLGSYAALSGIFMLFAKTHMDAALALQNPMLNSALFLAAFMITDPPTSPAKRMDQIVFGLLTGIISFLTFIIDPGELIYLFVGLLIANVIFFIKSQVYDKKDRKAKRDSAWTGERNVSGARS
nr:hypothetical protein [Bacilli bacterium]